MGKTHEALSVAEQQYDKYLQRTPVQPLPKVIATPSFRWTAKISSKKLYDDIKANLLNRNSNGSIKNILFIGTSNRERSFAHAINFSAALTKDFNLKVLLVDLSLWTLSPHEVFKINDTLGMYDLFAKGGRMASKITKVGPEKLFAVRWGGNHGGPVKQFESKPFGQFLEEMGNSFNYIILSAPQVASFSEFRTLCSKADGVVLILKAGKIGRQVALKAQNEQFESAKINLLGVVLDKASGSYSRFLLILGLVVGASLFLAVGFFFEHLQMKVRDARPLMTYDIPKADNKTSPKSKSQFYAQIQPHHYEQSNTLNDFSLSAFSLENTDYKINEMKGNNERLQAMNGLPAKSNREKTVPNTDNVVNGFNDAGLHHSHVVLVKKGDTLFRIINRTYGNFNEGILKSVLAENPEINGPKNIYPGQLLKLPALLNSH